MNKGTRGTMVSTEGLDKAGKSSVIRELMKEFPNWKYHSDPSYDALDGKLREIILYSRSLNSEAELFGYLLARAIEAEKIKEELEQGHTVVCDRWSDSTIVYQGYYRDWYSRIPREVFNYMNRIAVLATRPSLRDELEKVKAKFEEAGKQKDTEKMKKLLDEIDILEEEIKVQDAKGEDFFGVVPDITFFINTPPKICLERLNKEAEDKFDFELKNISKLNRLYEYYQYIYKTDKLDRIIKIDGDDSVRNIYINIKNHLIARGVIK